MKCIVYDNDNNTMFTHFKSANIDIVCVENITKTLFTEGFKYLTSVETSLSSVTNISHLSNPIIQKPIHDLFPL